MRYYLAGAYQRRAELAKYAVQLQDAGIGAVPISRWLWMDQTGEDAGFTADGLTTLGAVVRAWSYAQRDLEDLTTADAILSFTGAGGRGGRHIEHGVAISYRDNWPAMGIAAEPIRLVVIGPREHVFHCHPDTEVYPDFATFLAHEIKEQS
jgi:hypothetical protein